MPFHYMVSLLNSSFWCKGRRKELRLKFLKSHILLAKARAKQANMYVCHHHIRRMLIQRKSFLPPKQYKPTTLLHNKNVVIHVEMCLSLPLTISFNVRAHTHSNTHTFGVYAIFGAQMHSYVYRFPHENERRRRSKKNKQ